MGNGLRKFLAATQGAGGLSVLAAPVMMSARGLTLAWWYWILLESFGGCAVAAGIWLWRGDPRGWRLSRIMQALQIVQFQTARFGVAAVAGFQLRLLISEESVTVGPAFYGVFSIVAGRELPAWLNINFFAVYVLYALSRSGPSPESAETLATAPVEQDPHAETHPLGG